MSSGKSASGSKDYYGHCGGILCCGQLDFIWGLMVNNVLVWPQAALWDSKINKAGTMVVWTDGNVWQTMVDTSVDPGSFPWTLIASPWTAGTYNSPTMVLYLGNLWQCATTSNVAPPAAPTIRGTGVQSKVITNGWEYVSTPQVWSALANFWDANSIVAWEGRLYKTPSGTKAEPPAAPWVLWKTDRGSSANPLKMTVPNMGDAYLYWGTDTQTLDTVNEQVLNRLGHPPYRNRAFVMLKNFLFGTQQLNPPTVEV
ncbi:MAG TPA: hypothetical protein VFC07_06800, partial [Verrucomicrobiae bacterium]|nr:hypothetical protein [Verrucomicrobiae bacterium]